MRKLLWTLAVALLFYVSAYGQKQDLNTKLIAAIHGGNTEEVRKLLKRGADANAKDEHGTTALMWAGVDGTADMMRALIEKGADVNAKNNYGGTALIMAAPFSILNTDKVRVLLEKGADVNAKSEYGVTALMEGAMSFNPDVVRVLLASGADPNARDKDGETALMRAVDHQTTDAVRLLLEKGADVDVMALDGGTALSKAASHGYSDIVALLKNARAGTQNASVTNTTPGTAASDCARAEKRAALSSPGQAPTSTNPTVNAILALAVIARPSYLGGRLISAATAGKTSEVCSLLDQGADVNAKDQNGTALIHAAEHGHTDTVRILLDKGADMAAMDGSVDRATALVLAARNGHTDTVRVLLERGADVNGRNGLALRYAALNGDTKTVQLLLDGGADVDARDRDGSTALIEAVTGTSVGKGGMDTLVMLLRYGANPSIRGEHGWTALDFASGHPEMQELLRAAMAARADYSSPGNTSRDNKAKKSDPPRKPFDCWWDDNQKHTVCGHKP